jgi:hypothetical protein
MSLKPGSLSPRSQMKFDYEVRADSSARRDQTKLNYIAISITYEFAILFRMAHPIFTKTSIKSNR